MDVEDLILIRGFSKLAICKSRLTAHGAGGGKGSIKTRCKACPSTAPCSPQHLRSRSPLFQEMDLLLLWGKWGGWRGRGTAQCHPAHTGPADVVPYHRDLAGEQQWPEALRCWCLHPGTWEGGHDSGTQPMVPRDVPGNPSLSAVATPVGLGCGEWGEQGAKPSARASHGCSWLELVLMPPLAALWVLGWGHLQMPRAGQGQEAAGARRRFSHPPAGIFYPGSQAEISLQPSTKAESPSLSPRLAGGWRRLRRARPRAAGGCPRHGHWQG